MTGLRPADGIDHPTSGNTKPSTPTRDAGVPPALAGSARVGSPFGIAGLSVVRIEEMGRGTQEADVKSRPYARRSMWPTILKVRDSTLAVRFQIPVHFRNPTIEMSPATKCLLSLQQSKEYRIHAQASRSRARSSDPATPRQYRLYTVGQSLFPKRSFPAGT